MTSTLENVTLPQQEAAEGARRAYELDRKHVFHSWSAQDLIDPWSSPRPRAPTSGTATATSTWTSPRSWSTPTSATSTPPSCPPSQARPPSCARSPRSYVNDARSEALRLIAGRTPGELNKIFFTNGGADANEHAIRMARLHTGRHKVLSAYRSYHGGTQLAINVTGYRRRWPSDTPALGTVHFFPAVPVPHRLPLHHRGGGKPARPRTLGTADGASKARPPSPPSSWKASRARPESHVPPPGIPGRASASSAPGTASSFIADEVMSGFGRTGTLVRRRALRRRRPDLLTFAKGVNSGYVPLGGVAISAGDRSHVRAPRLPRRPHLLGPPAGRRLPPSPPSTRWRTRQIVQHAAALGEKVIGPGPAWIHRAPPLGR